MVRVRADIRAAEERLRIEGQNFLRGAQNEYQLAANQEGSLAASLAATKRESLDSNSLMVEYSVLKREVDSSRQLFQSLVGRAKETGLETELKSSERAHRGAGGGAGRPLHPPAGMRNYQLALLIGLALGIGLTLLFEHLDNTVKTPEDVKEQLGLPFLGMVPDVGAAARPAPARGRRP